MELSFFERKEMVENQLKTRYTIKSQRKRSKNMKKILEDIKTNTYERFYLFYGEEKYMISQMKNQLKKALVSEDDTMNYSYFEGKKADSVEIAELAKTLPFFSDHRFIILDETGLGKKSDDSFIDALKEASDTSVLLFIEDSVDKRSKIYKFLSKEGHVVCFESAGDKELSRWLMSLLKKEGKQMSSSTMRSFLYRCGSDMYTLKNELEKLISYTEGREVVTAADIQAVCTTQTTNKIFDMVRAVTEKNQKRALDLYYDLLTLREPPMRILFLLAIQFRQI